MIQLLLRASLLLILVSCSTSQKKSETTKVTFPPDLKKIEVVKTNNGAFFAMSGRHTFPPFKPDNLKKLKSYIERKGFKPTTSNETELVLKALNWVSSQWDHDGLNQPPKHFNALDILKTVHNKKEKYRCVEYGLVLSEVLQAYGFVSRTVALRSKDVAYGGWGKGHVAMEVWINDLNKWIFLDPQFGSYLTLKNKNTPLNYREAFLIEDEGNWNNIKINFVSKPPQPINTASKEYKNFLKMYFGHMTVSSGKKKPNISLFLESKNPTLTFQAHPSDNVVFTSNSSLVYPEINKVSLFLSYREKANNFNKLIQSLNIKTNQDYVNQMPKFAAKPKYSVQLKNNMPSFSHYEYRVAKSGRWTKIKKDSLKWDAINSINTLQTRAVNKMGRSGPITFIEVSYQ